MFHHPVYIRDFPLCRQAIEEVLRLIDEKRALAVHWGNDAACLWWHARSQSNVGATRIADDGTMTFDAECPHDGGMIVKVPVDARAVEEVRCDSEPASYEVRHEFGGDWLHVIVPAGRHEVRVVLRQ
jgi:hypothetical protein